MEIRYLGTHPVDIPGHEGVEPGQVVDVADEVGASLLLAGASFADDGEVTPPAEPLWEIPTAKPAKPPKNTPDAGADAGKES